MLYLASRILAVVLGLVFSIIYSRGLGPSNRGILTSVFLFTVVLSQILLSGVNLTFKSQIQKFVNKEYVWAFISYSLFAATTISLANIMFLKFFYFFNQPIANKYIIASSIYVFLAILSDQLTQLLVAKERLKLLWKIESMTVVMQLSFFLLFQALLQNSLAVRIFLSYSLSYAVICAIAILGLKNELRISITYSTLKFGINSLLKQSTHNIYYASLTGIADRVDRIIVLIAFNSQMFGKYSLFTGLIITLRFLPDTIANLIFNGHFIFVRSLIERHRLKLVAFLLLISTLASIIVQQFIILFFGKEWLIGIDTIILFTFAEGLRALYWVIISFKFKNSISETDHTHAALMIVLISIGVGAIAWFVGEVNLVPAGLILSYIIVFFRLTSKVA